MIPNNRNAILFRMMRCSPQSVLSGKQRVIDVCGFHFSPYTWKTLNFRNVAFEFGQGIRKFRGCSRKTAKKIADAVSVARKEAGRRCD